MYQENLKGRLKVFDTSLYINLNSELRAKVVKEDIAGIVIEAGDRPLEERINPRKLKITNGSVIDPVTGKNVLEEFATATELNRKETEGAISFYSHLVMGEVESLIFSLSPSGGPANYIESRINVALRISDEDVEFYGIPSHLTPTSLLNYATKLTEWSDISIPQIDPEDLRRLAIPVNIPFSEDVWQFLDKELPLDTKAWETIFTELPWHIKAMAEKDADWVSQEMSTRLSLAPSESERISIGAWGERMMQAKGWKLNPLACPGLFNSEILGETDLFDPGQGIVHDAFGNLRLTGSGETDGGKFIKNCGNIPECGKPINKRMKAGDLCPHCGKIYKGC